MLFFLVCCLLTATSFAGDLSLAKERSLLSEEDLCWLEEQRGPPQELSFEEISLVFKKTKNLSKQIVKPTSVAARPENREKNAHADLLPFDETRTLREKEAFYINANDILTPSGRYIATQCPLPSGVADFWRAVLGARAPTIVALLMPHDAGGRHSQYWSKDLLPVSVDGWAVSLVGSDELVATSASSPEQKIVLRHLVARKKDQERSLCHLHYENWPDFGAPAPDLFSALLHVVDVVHPDPAEPLLVHCAAGTGRSGTFIAAHSLRKELLAGAPSINIPERILSLRLQRPKMVNSTKQCAAIYQALLAPLSAGYAIVTHQPKKASVQEE